MNDVSKKIDELHTFWIGKSDSMSGYLKELSSRVEKIGLWSEYRKLECSKEIASTLQRAVDEITMLLGNDKSVKDQERAVLFDRKETLTWILTLFGDDSTEKTELHSIEKEIDGEYKDMEQAKEEE